ncbi:hypothetical protein [Nocardia huaxiensis]|uniref:Glycosyltransferase RgtA/B/C/D-like domain-containing protein n=1 Tax=Nocardia huaxiensis TaxID=2755382 RepID=A0A7D6Z8K6_9NOCA|nr:hypothetical protein [Nocardia huaxiensis]QLY29648.1 hypothetical protein H0264_31120 [Nocardia huaxiensis]UFS96777.1 hypothetical protein LPY97_02260 [Nocardia huaxiensis]
MVAGIAIATIVWAPAPMAAPWDPFNMLDGAYRILRGQSAGADFHNPIGPLLYCLISLGMRLQDTPSLAAIGYGSVVMLAILAPIAWWVARRRLPAPYAAVFTVFTALLLVAVRPLHYATDITSYAMLYNRWGWALFGIVLLLACVRPVHTGARRAAIVEAVLLGLLLGMLFYDKLNFFGVAVVMIVFGIIAGTAPRRPAELLGVAAGFGVVLGGMWIGFGVSLGGYLADVADAAKTIPPGMRLQQLWTGVRDVAPIAVLTLLALAVLAAISRQQAATIVRLTVVIAAIGGSSLLISTLNAQERNEIPALALIPLLFVAFLGPRLPRWAGGPGEDQDHRWPIAAALAAAALLLIATMGVITARDGIALAGSVTRHDEVVRPPASQRIASDHLRDYYIPADSQWVTAYRTAHDVPAMLNDGIALLERHNTHHDSIFTIAATDPFSFALSTPPTRGAFLWWDLDFDFNRTHYPDANQIFPDAHWIMIPRMIAGQGCCQETVDVMLELYRPYLSAHFHEADRTDNWILLARNP